ncbi:hypothetical protein [Cohnella fermenti]|uniref:Uncharacterized protein n=1 Tax=Cohnella fermenti TaxID=2565925 RepID=A0A4S4BRE8_9BACL|nr:hypothetical protein [Cohnella fermenti]THF77548.1 hypothetical protein E6C55_16155 [Cohnella fermenti]
MDLYHSWLYRHVINTEGFMWTVVCLLLGFNILLPVFIWYFTRGRKIIKSYLKHKKRLRAESGNQFGEK